MLDCVRRLDNWVARTLYLCLSGSICSVISRVTRGTLGATRGP